MRPLLPLLFLSSIATAQSAPDAVTLARRVDSLATSAIEKGPLAGLAIVVARGDRIQLAKGYGYADLENRVPASAETIFNGAHRAQEVRTQAVHLIDEADARHAVLVGLTPNRFRLRLHTSHGVEHSNRAIEHVLGAARAEERRAAEKK